MIEINYSIPNLKMGEIIKIKTEREGYKDECKYCGQVIIGNSKNHVDVLMIQHKLAKHRDKITIKEKK